LFKLTVHFKAVYSIDGLAESHLKLLLFRL